MIKWRREGGRHDEEEDTVKRMEGFILITQYIS